MASYLASLEVDQRQRLILQADKLQEMLGASRLIEQTVEMAKALLSNHGKIELVTPVSGVLRFRCSDLQALGAFLWELRIRIVEDLHLPSTFTIVDVQTTDFKPSVDKLEEKVRNNKDAKTGETSRPASPLFAQCLIQPQLSANCWDPQIWRHSENPRRSLVSTESDQRHNLSGETFSKQFKKFAQLEGFANREKKDLWDALPKEFSQLATGSEDSYIAFVKADGDGMGRLLMQLDWDKLGMGNGAGACLEFSQELEICLESSTKTAVDAVTKEWKYSDSKRFPVAPLVRAGEDYWIVCRRELAFQLAIELGNAYAEMTKKNEIISKALGMVEELKGERLTLSFGILFAKQGFPFEAQLHMAESLIKNAKRFRKEHAWGSLERTGCLDYYWLESSAREDVIQHRDANLQIVDAGHRFRLFTTPWTLPETKQFLDAAIALSKANFPARKLNQLESILRLGSDFSKLAFQHWRQMLQPKEWEHIVNAVKILPARFQISEAIQSGEPFLPMAPLENQCWTPLLDLMKIVEIQEMH